MIPVEAIREGVGVYKKSSLNLVSCGQSYKQFMLVRHSKLAYCLLANEAEVLPP